MFIVNISRNGETTQVKFPLVSVLVLVGLVVLCVVHPAFIPVLLGGGVLGTVAKLIGGGS